MTTQQRKRSRRSKTLSLATHVLDYNSAACANGTSKLSHVHGPRDQQPMTRVLISLLALFASISAAAAFLPKRITIGSSSYPSRPVSHWRSAGWNSCQTESSPRVRDVAIFTPSQIRFPMRRPKSTSRDSPVASMKFWDWHGRKVSFTPHSHANFHD